MTRRWDSLAAEAAFRARLAGEGAVLLEPAWLGSNSPHRIRCGDGHEAGLRPHSILSRGQGICKPCADIARDARLAVRNSPRTSSAGAAFRARLTELGATLLETEWLGSNSPHRVRCSEGHESSPTPHHIVRGIGACIRCNARGAQAARAKFLALLAEQGAVLLEPVWLGTRHPHRVRCAAGHECTPRPFSILQGNGICRICAGQIWDAFYIVSASALHRIKFGITSGDPKGRLKVHRINGYRDTVRLLTGLPGSTAPDLERCAISALRLADLRPVQGREYYDVSALPIVLDVVDNYPMDLARAA